MHLHPAAALALLLAVTACDVKVSDSGVSVDIAEGTAADEWTRTYPLGPGDRLEIVNDTGTIRVTAASGTEVTVRARREVRTDSEETSRGLLRKIEMQEQLAPGRVRVEARPPAAEGFADRVGRRLRVDYDVAVPQGLALDLRTQNGGVNLENIGGSIVAASTNGAINGRGVSGSLAASTVNGGIQVDLASVSGDVSLVTVNGGVRLDLPPEVRATLDARAVNGGVSVDERLPFQATEQGRLHVAGSLNGGGPKISAQTTNGGVRVAARDAAAAAVRSQAETVK